MYINFQLIQNIESQDREYFQKKFMKKKSISVDKVREIEGTLSSNDIEIDYKALYPDKDKKSIYSTLRNEFGYWMTFKSISWRTEEFLLKRITELKKNDEYSREQGGFEIKIKIIDVR